MAESAPTITFKGRQFSSKEIELIKEVIATCGRLSRQELANTVCELVEWQRPNRGLKTGEARGLLEKLESEGFITLPPPTKRGRPKGSKTKITQTKRGEPQAELRASIQDVEPIRLRLVETEEERQFWRELVSRYHPEGHRVPVGAHLRYFIEVSRPSMTVVGCLQLSSPAWKMKDRDKFIGWNESQHLKNLQKIVTQSRFLILPWVHVPNLASYVLGLMVREFPKDWRQAYGVEPVMLETLVDEDHAGTCYRAANWVLVGQTTGRGRMDSGHQRNNKACRKVFLFPLIANAIEILQEEETESDDTKSDTTESIENNIKYNKKSKESKKKKLEEIAKCHELLKGRLDERARRCWMGAEAVSLGRGGLALVTKACKANHTTVQEGMREVREPAAEDLERIRQPGGGSKPIEKRLPGIEKELEKLVDPDTRGDPESPLRWTTKSLHHLADALTKRGFPVGKDAVGILLKKLGYSLKAPSKTLEGNQHPDRDEQFRYIAQKSQAFLDAGEPVISVDTKKKEKVGNYRNAGTEYEPKGHVQEVEMHDFGDRDEEGRIIHGIPYGVYDIKANNGWVSVGVDHDTSVFAVSTIRNWLKNMGKPAYPNCKKILITADSGGSNGSRVRAFKVELQRLADETGIAFHVAHLPPGTSKWNKIEHRMFSQITLNWRGRPLTCHETIVNLIASTTTKTGLKIQAMLDTERYPIGIKISKKEFGSIKINGDIFHPEWNYAIIPSDARMEK